MPEMKPMTPAAQNLRPGPAPSRRRRRSLQSLPVHLKQIASDPPFSVLMAGGAFGRGVVKDNQTVDGNAGPRIDEKWIDVDGGNSSPGTPHAFEQANPPL